MSILKVLASFSQETVIFCKKKHSRCGIVLWYAMKYASIILRLSLSWLKASMAKF